MCGVPWQEAGQAAEEAEAGLEAQAIKQWTSFMRNSRSMQVGCCPLDCMAARLWAAAAHGMLPSAAASWLDRAYLVLYMAGISVQLWLLPVP